MHHDPAVEAELHVEFIGISGWTGVVDEIDITLGLTGTMGAGFCLAQILFRQRQQAFRDVSLEVSQVRRVSFSASAQNKTACSCGRVYVSQGVVWYPQRQFSTIVVSSAITSAKYFAQSTWRLRRRQGRIPEKTTVPQPGPSCSAPSSRENLLNQCAIPFCDGYRRLKVPARAGRLHRQQEPAAPSTFTSTCGRSHRA